MSEALAIGINSTDLENTQKQNYFLDKKRQISCSEYKLNFRSEDIYLS